MGGHTIVEIGSIRDADGQQSDGHSTLAWAESGLDVWSVDVDMRATHLTAGLLGDRYPHVSCINGDGIRFLDNFTRKIDLSSIRRRGWSSASGAATRTCLGRSCRLWRSTMSRSHHRRGSR